MLENPCQLKWNLKCLFILFYFILLSRAQINTGTKSLTEATMYYHQKVFFGIHLRGIEQVLIKFIPNIPDSKVHGANMGPIWGRQDPGGPHVGPMNFAIWDCSSRLYFNISITSPQSQWVNRQGIAHTWRWDMTLFCELKVWTVFIFLQ